MTFRVTTLSDAGNEVMGVGMAPSPSSDRMQLVTTPEFLRLVDEWRRKQPDIPNRSEAIRRMVKLAAEAHEKAEAGEDDAS